MLGLMVFGAIGLWAALTCLMLAYLLRRIWRGIREKPGTDWHRRTAVFGIFVLAWLLGFFWYGGGRNYYYDAEVKRLCAIDGGVKVYETVTLPPDRFDEQGHIKLIFFTGIENSLGPEYIYEFKLTYFRRKTPEIRRIHDKVIRRADGKLLGESISYDRNGGSVPFLVVTSYECPSSNDSGSRALFNRIFIKSM